MKSKCSGKMEMNKGGAVKGQMPPMKGAKAVRQDKQMAMPKGGATKAGSCKW